MISQFLKYYLRAETIYSAHSPFIYLWEQEVLEDNRHYYVFDSLASLRQQLAQKQDLLEIKDFGAGSRVHKSNTRKVSDILNSSVSPEWQCQFLFRLVNFLQPQTKLELGSSLGLSTLYQYFPNQDAQFISLEGSPQIAAIAKANFEAFECKNLELMVGNFDQTLELALDKLGKLDYAFIDGNHRGEATLRYFEQCLPYVHGYSVLVFDDIYWSKDMTEAWEKIKAHPSVRMSIDLFWAGMVFFRTEQLEKRHYSLIRQRYKPWRIGLFG